MAESCRDEVVRHRLREHGGDALLARLLWTPAKSWDARDVWSYYTTWPRRYALEPVLRAVKRYRYRCRCEGINDPKHVETCPGALEYSLELEGRLFPGTKNFWVLAKHVALNPEYASELARFERPSRLMLSVKSLRRGAAMIPRPDQ
jgi:hypothetical protein